MNQVNLKNTIIVAWLDLDPDQLAAEVPLEGGNYVRWETLANYARQHRNAAFEAFEAYMGKHATALSGCVSRDDWVDFLDALRRARAIASGPLWEAPRDGVVFRNPF